MLSRALSLATAMLLIGFATPTLITSPAQAQNLEAGKSPAQLFSANCSVCHKSARGLLKAIAPGDLPGYLRQHYTTSPDMAKALSAYLVSNGAGGGRSANDDGLTRRGRELSREQAPASEEVAEPVKRRGRKADRLRPAEAAPATEGEQPAPKGHGKKKHGKHEAPKTEARPATDKSESAAPARPAEESKPTAETAKPEATKPEAAKPEAAKPEAPATRADPVPAVTPAPKEAEPAPAPAAPAKPDAQ